MMEMERPVKSRFPLILAGSVALHVLLLAALYGSWMYGVALKFGTISFEDTGEARHLDRAALERRMKPLFLPKGFYAVEKPPTAEELAEREEPRPERPEPEKPEKEEPEEADGEEEGADDETAEKGEPEEPEKPAADMKFGTIRGGSLRPHILQVYTAYERGLIDVDTFAVTVSCTAERDGSLSNIRVVKSSGDEMIDRTAVNLFKELSDMHALAPLSTLSSLSLTLEVGPSTSALTAVGFAGDPGVTLELANQLGAIQTLARWNAKNDDERTLINNVKISQAGNRVSVRLGLPNSAASDMMRRSFGGKETAATGA